MSKRLEIEIIGRNAGLKRALSDSKREVETFSGSLGKMAKIATGAFVGFQAVKGVTHMIGDAASAAGDFTQTLSVLKATSNATSKEMALISAKAIALGADIRLPATSAKDAADAMLELAKGGLTARQSMKAAHSVLLLSAAAQIDNATAARTVADALHMFGLEAKDAKVVVDDLAGAANASTASMTDVTESLAQVGASAKALKVPIGDVTTAIAMMANAGIKGGMAGSAMNVMFSRLAAPTKKAAELMKSVGIHVFDAHGKFIGLRASIAQISPIWNKMTDQQKQQLAVTIAGTRGAKAFQIVMAGGLPLWDKTHKAVVKTGQAQKLADAQSKGYNGAMAGLRSTLETLQITIGLKLLPAFEKLARKATDWLSAYMQTKSFKDLLKDTGIVAEAMGKFIVQAFKTGADAVRAAWSIGKQLHEAYEKNRATFQALFGVVQRVAGAFRSLGGAIGAVPLGGAIATYWGLSKAVGAVGGAAKIAAGAGSLRAVGSIIGTMIKSPAQAGAGFGLLAGSLKNMISPTTAVIAGVALLAGGILYLSGRMTTITDAAKSWLAAMNNVRDTLNGLNNSNVQVAVTTRSYTKAVASSGSAHVFAAQQHHKLNQMRQDGVTSGKKYEAQVRKTKAADGAATDAYLTARQALNAKNDAEAAAAVSANKNAKANKEVSKTLDTYITRANDAARATYNANLRAHRSASTYDLARGAAWKFGESLKKAARDSDTLSPKQQKLTENVAGYIQKIGKIPSKHDLVIVQRMIVHGNTLAQIKAYLDGLKDKTVTVTTVAVQKMLSRKAKGGPITSPQVMVGEEAPQHPEWVIATNPAYHDANVGYWAQAGNALGIPGFKKGGHVYTGHKTTAADKHMGTAGISSEAAKVAAAAAKKKHDDAVLKAKAEQAKAKAKRDAAQVEIDKWTAKLKTDTATETTRVALQQSYKDFLTNHTDGKAEFLGRGKNKKANPKHKAWQDHYDLLHKTGASGISAMIKAIKAAIKTDKHKLGLSNKDLTHWKSALGKADTGVEDAEQDVQDAADAAQELRDAIPDTDTPGGFDDRVSALNAKLAEDIFNQDAGAAGADVQSLIDAYTGRISTIKGMMGDADPARLKAITDELPGDYQSITDFKAQLKNPLGLENTDSQGNGITADEQAQLDQLRTLGYTKLKGQALQAASDSVFNGAGGLHLTVNSLHPGDSDVLQAIAATVTSALDRQPSVGASRQTTLI